MIEHSQKHFVACELIGGKSIGESHEIEILGRLFGQGFRDVTTHPPVLVPPIKSKQSQASAASLGEFLEGHQREHGTHPAAMEREQAERPIRHGEMAANTKLCARCCAQRSSRLRRWVWYIS